jgi:hypothetical protein
MASNEISNNSLRPPISLSLSLLLHTCLDMKDAKCCTLLSRRCRCCRPGTNDENLVKVLVLIMTKSLCISLLTLGCQICIQSMHSQLAKSDHQSMTSWPTNHLEVWKEAMIQWNTCTYVCK